jgi:N-acetylmuramoyl-L-alanine amidase
VKLTRNSDTFIKLSRRTAIANAFGADLFISVHANASPKKSARGLETYFLDRSSDRSARRVAAVENKSSETGVRETEQILADVLLNMKLPESKRLAESVQKAMLDRVSKSFGSVRDLGVKRAPFYVLTGAVMPAILLEAGFISNSTEAKWLKNPKYHDVIADGVAAAVVEYSAGL